ncbi:hypothetical protein BSL78_02296 [Apostichopus japonicus]|uniref:C2H2-type domain-containing protein n=1 Tax=Stichopus japonicus TaxID=307972 RepID=A0A2G8LKQ4_STIJA|nr:hypothetical protein BSL78_02296 [Apostichopus japonicus]
MGFVCSQCGIVINGSPKALLWHLRIAHHLINGHVFTKSIACGQNGCERSFSGRTAAFRKHLGTHNYDNDDVPVHVPVPAPPDADFADVPADNLDADHDEVEPDEPEGELWDELTTEEVENRAAMLVAGLLASSSTVHSTVTQVVEQASDLINDMSSFMMQRVKQFATTVGIPHDDQHLQALLTDIDGVSHPFRNVGSQYKQRKFFQNCKAFVAAEELPMGVAYYPVNNPSTGNVQQHMKTVTFQYIPIKPLMKMILEETDVLKISSTHMMSEDGLLRDFQDGSFCRESPLLSSSATIKLILYVDDFEVSNPLSPKAGIHKLGAVYFTIANLPPKYRSTLSNMLLLMLFNSGDASLYGYGAVFAQFIQDINELIADGLHIVTNFFNGNVKIAIGQIVGDNLGIHSLFGFAGGFTANYLCRVCKLHRDAIRTSVKEQQGLLRTLENYQADVAQDDLQQTGVKSPCALNDISHFHVINSRSPDIMHDILEGVCPLELKLVLQQLIHKELLTLNELNARVTSFNYGIPDKRNKPVPFTANALRSPDGAPGQNAAQMWCLIRHVAVMLGDLVPEGDEHWELLLALLDCLDIIFSPIISNGDTKYLSELISDHHQLFLELFPERHLKPKHHFMTHYPSAIRLNGPLIHLWVMRFEAFHNFSTATITHSVQLPKHSKNSCLSESDVAMFQYPVQESFWK